MHTYFAAFAFTRHRIVRINVGNEPVDCIVPWCLRKKQSVIKVTRARNVEVACQLHVKLEHKRHIRGKRPR